MILSISESKNDTSLYIKEDVSIDSKEI